MPSMRLLLSLALYQLIKIRRDAPQLFRVLCLKLVLFTQFDRPKIKSHPTEGRQPPSKQKSLDHKQQNGDPPEPGPEIPAEISNP